jgi:ABC-type multidrug transport system fused ATPase/permease subunit
VSWREKLDPPSQPCERSAEVGEASRGAALLRGVLYEHRRLALSSLAAGLAWSGTRIAMPTFVRRAVDAISREDVDGLGWATFALVVCGCLAALFAGFRRLFGQSLGARIENSLRRRLHSPVEPRPRLPRALVRRQAGLAQRFGSPADSAAIHQRTGQHLDGRDGHIFDGSVADNLHAVRREADAQQLEQALRAVGAYEHFAAKPRGLASAVGARGALLSAGERQLLSLARVALLEADLLILDEATSNLDTGTELLVNQALDRLMEDRTVVVVAHRLSIAERVDRIALVADGGIAELGSHRELLERRGRYARLYHQWQATHRNARPLEPQG